MDIKVMDIKVIPLAATAIVFSFNVNASVVNTLNGANYEWLELTATAGMSRAQVEAGIAAASPGDSLYGYEYASRQLVEDLFLSYASWDGRELWHDNSEVVDGTTKYLNDFGILYTFNFSSIFNVLTVDYELVPTNGESSSGFLFGLSSECGLLLQTCGGSMAYHSMDGVPVVAYQQANYGWDATTEPHLISADYASPYIGSHLVRISSVPVPTAVWLFGSGLIGLIGVARRKKL